MKNEAARFANHKKKMQSLVAFSFFCDLQYFSQMHVTINGHHNVLSDNRNDARSSFW